MDVKAGEYLLAVNGKDVRPPASLFAPFENTSGRIVELTGCDKTAWETARPRGGPPNRGHATASTSPAAVNAAPAVRVSDRPDTERRFSATPAS